MYVYTSNYALCVGHASGHATLDNLIAMQPVMRTPQCIRPQLATQRCAESKLDSRWIGGSAPDERHGGLDVGPFGCIIIQRKVTSGQGACGCGESRACDDASVWFLLVQQRVLFIW